MSRKKENIVIHPLLQRWLPQTFFCQSVGFGVGLQLDFRIGQGLGLWLGLGMVRYNAWSMVLIK